MSNRLQITAFFEKRLHAPLKNPVWSWGAVSKKGNQVFLRVGSWALENYGKQGKWVVLYTPEWKKRRLTGATERMQHIEMLRNGIDGYALIVEFGKDEKIKSFDREKLLKLGNLEDHNGTIYAQVTEQLSIDDVIEQSKRPHDTSNDISKIVEVCREITERESMINSRIGQGEFRESVLDVWDYKCAVTGSGTISAIRASHIKPWRVSTSRERMDKYNGIPLLATFDALFDRGLISFGVTGKMLVSPQLSSEEQVMLGLPSSELIIEIPKRCQHYLRYHRDEVFLHKDAPK